MFDAATIDAADKPAAYGELARQLRALLADERDAVANMANTSAVVFGALPDLNWAGFYLLRGDTLVLGPFQGRPACVRIPSGRGVCGAAVERRASVLVADVHAFPGHIACDAASRSELVVPMFDGRICRGVIDLDSPVEGRFDPCDQAGVEAIAAIVAEASDWPGRP